MPTSVDLKVGLTLEIGSIPVSLDAEIVRTDSETVYTFDGCVQDADIALGDFLAQVARQFGVSLQLPPELNLEAAIDYIAGQLTYTTGADSSTSTALSVSAAFALITPGGDTFAFQVYADTKLGGDAPASGNPYVVGVSVETELAFARLPLVGDVPGLKDLALTHVGFSYTSATPPTTGAPATTFNVPQVSRAANPLYTRGDGSAPGSWVYSIDTSGPTEQFTLNQGGFSLTAGIQNTVSKETLNNLALPMNLPATSGNGGGGAASPFYPQPTSPPAGPVHWIDVNKTFGPVTVKQIGLNYAAGEATFGFSAAFSLGGFSLSLQGLSISFPMPGLATGKEVGFDLDGLGLDFKQGAVEVGGAFLKADASGVTSYYGEVIVQAASFGLKALGGYTPTAPPSFFLYANLDAPLGGPPFLFVTGLAAGFGINRQLKLPTIDQLSTFPLLPGNAPPQPSSPADAVALVPQLQAIFVDAPGEYWVAAGIRFTSFEMVQAFALVTVAFGVDTQIGLLGSCSMTFPTGDPNPVAYIEVDLVASFTPSTGTLAVDGKLSPASYVYGGFCKLSGGFAFYTWFAGAHQGDFVVTVGGYHPAFSKPDHYPAVPRLTMSYGLGAFHVTGQAYVALTPAMMMAGLRMTAVWSAGSVSAWFDAGVDFLIAWAPFHYEADASVNIGCKADVGLFTVEVHVGADLSVWGPPFGGRAHVDLDVASFTISFGAPPSSPAPVGWSAFRSNFLPKDSDGQPGPRPVSVSLASPAGVPAAPAPTTNIIKASVADGLLKTDVDIFDWIVDSEQFAIVTSSTIPANNAEWTLSSGVDSLPNSVDSYPTDPSTYDFTSGPYPIRPSKTFSDTLVWNPALHIRPMKQDSVQSYHTITLRRRSGDDPRGSFSDYCTRVSVQAVLLDVSTAVWSDNDNQSPNDPALMPLTLTGLLIAPAPGAPVATNDVSLLELLFGSGHSTGFAFTHPQPDATYTVTPSTDDDQDLVIAVGGAHSATLINRDYILSSLGDAWVTAQRALILGDLATSGFSTLTPDEIDVRALATETPLTDWPAVALLGADAA